MHYIFAYLTRDQVKKVKSTNLFASTRPSHEHLPWHEKQSEGIEKEKKKRGFESSKKKTWEKLLLERIKTQAWGEERKRKEKPH
jgi:hypothetical protein